MSEAKAWLWPDHVIGKHESRRLREEHNRVVNELANIALDRSEGSPWDHGYKCGFADGVDDVAPTLIDAARKVCDVANERNTRDLWLSTESLRRIVAAIDANAPAEPAPLVTAARQALAWIEGIGAGGVGRVESSEIGRILRAALGQESGQ